MFKYLYKNKTIAPVLIALTINMTVISYIQATGSDANADSEKTFEQLRMFVNRQMAEKAVPGVAMGVLHNGKFHTAGFGITNVDNPQLVTDNTLFQIGSITKTMTGTIMMRLAEQGKLDLDAPVRAYLPDFKVKDEQVSAQATVRSLLTHMSGWVGDHFSDTGEGNNALALMMAEIEELEQLAPINAVYSYNNSGFYVAAQIIEVVTGEYYQDVLQKMIFDDIGLKQSYIVPTTVMTKPYVVGHYSSESGVRIAEPWNLYRAAWAAGGGIMSIGDMLKYAQFHMGDGKNDAGVQVMKQQSLTQMQAQQAPKVGTDESVGITWHLSQVGDINIVAHGGATNGQLAYLLLVPEHNFAMAMLTNSSNGRALNAAVTELALELYFDAKKEQPKGRTLSDKELAEFTGTYARPFVKVIVSAVDGKLMIQSIPQKGFMSDDIPPPSPLREFGIFNADRIVDMNGTQQAEFIRKEDGTIGWLRMSRILVKQ